MGLLVDQYRKSVAYYEKTWKVIDGALYRLCRENPDHARRSSVCAKLWIIGRTYATGLERKVATTGTQGSSMSQVTEYFLNHSAEIDKLFEQLRHLPEPLDPQRLSSSVCGFRPTSLTPPWSDKHRPRPYCDAQRIPVAVVPADRCWCHSAYPCCGG